MLSIISVTADALAGIQGLNIATKAFLQMAKTGGGFPQPACRLASERSGRWIRLELPTCKPFNKGPHREAFPEVRARWLISTVTAPQLWWRVCLFVRIRQRVAPTSF
jgi:hypothetical protein